MSTTLEAAPGTDAISSPDRASHTASPARQQRRWPLILFVLVVAAGGTIGLFSTDLLDTASRERDDLAFRVTRRSFPIIEESKGELKAARTIEIKSRVEGRSTIKWVIEEGRTVKKGELLVSLSSDQIDDRIRKSEAELASAVAALEASEKDFEILVDENASDIRKAELKLELSVIDLKKYLEGDAINAAEDADAEVARSLDMLERAGIDHDAAVDLFDKKFITRSELLQDKFELDEAKRSVEKANRNKRTLEEYTHPKEIKRYTSDKDEAGKELIRVRKSALAKKAQKKADVEAKRANLLNVQSELKKYREQKEFAEIHAPSPGIVVYNTGHRYNPQSIDVGAEVYEGQTLVKLPDPSVMVISVRIHEAKTHKIKLGQPVRVEVQGIPGEIFSGKISKIAPLADSRNSWLNPDLKEYETEITLEDAREDLKPGSTARAEIFVAELVDQLAVPVQAVFSEAGRQFVFVKQGRSIDPVLVSVGQSSTEYVQILDGISEGVDVMLAVSANDRLKITDLIGDDETTPEVTAASSKARRPSPSRRSRPKGRHRGKGPGRS